MVLKYCNVRCLSRRVSCIVSCKYTRCGVLYAAIDPVSPTARPSMTSIPATTHILQPKPILSSSTAIPPSTSHLSTPSSTFPSSYIIPLLQNHRLLHPPLYSHPLPIIRPLIPHPRPKILHTPNLLPIIIRQRIRIRRQRRINPIFPNSSIEVFLLLSCTTH